MLKKDKDNLMLEMSKPEVISDGEKIKALNNLFQRVEKELASLNSQFEDAYLQLMEMEG